MEQTFFEIVKEAVPFMSKVVICAAAIGFLVFAFMKGLGRLEKVEMRIDSLDKRVDHFEKQTNQRFDRLEARIDKLDEKFDRKFDTIITLLLSSKKEETLNS